jgi:hypothetical protein
VVGGHSQDSTSVLAQQRYDSARLDLGDLLAQSVCGGHERHPIIPLASIAGDSHCDVSDIPDGLVHLFEVESIRFRQVAVKSPQDGLIEITDVVSHRDSIALETLAYLACQVLRARDTMLNGSTRACQEQQRSVHERSLL